MAAGPRPSKRRRHDGLLPEAADYSWHKYGQKVIAGGASTRAYYRCSRSAQGCGARKTVDTAGDGSACLQVQIVGEHDHKAGGTVANTSGDSAQNGRLTHAPKDGVIKAVGAGAAACVATLCRSPGLGSPCPHRQCTARTTTALCPSSGAGAVTVAHGTSCSCRPPPTEQQKGSPETGPQQQQQLEGQEQAAVLGACHQHGIGTGSDTPREAPQFVDATMVVPCPPLKRLKLLNNKAPAPRQLPNGHCGQAQGTGVQQQNVHTQLPATQLLSHPSRHPAHCPPPTAQNEEHRPWETRHAHCKELVPPPLKPRQLLKLPTVPRAPQPPVVSYGTQWERNPPTSAHHQHEGKVERTTWHGPNGLDETHCRTCGHNATMPQGTHVATSLAELTVTRGSSNYQHLPPPAPCLDAEAVPLSATPSSLRHQQQPSAVEQQHASYSSVHPQRLAPPPLAGCLAPCWNPNLMPSTYCSTAPSWCCPAVPKVFSPAGTPISQSHLQMAPSPPVTHCAQAPPHPQVFYQTQEPPHPGVSRQEWAEKHYTPPAPQAEVPGHRLHSCPSQGTLVPCSAQSTPTPEAGAGAHYWLFGPPEAAAYPGSHVSLASLVGQLGDASRFTASAFPDANVAVPAKEGPEVSDCSSSTDDPCYLLSAKLRPWVSMAASPSAGTAEAISRNDAPEPCALEHSGGLPGGQDGMKHSPIGGELSEGEGEAASNKQCLKSLTGVGVMARAQIDLTLHL